VISPTQGPLNDNKQHSQQTDIHAPGGILTHKREAADPRFRPRGRWNQQDKKNTVPNNKLFTSKNLVYSVLIFC